MIVNNYRTRITLALLWLLAIYGFLPFAPDIFKTICRVIKYEIFGNILIFFCIVLSLLIFIPYIKKFKNKKTAPYFIITAALLTGCTINFSIRPISRMLHIPEYAVFGVLLFFAIIKKFSLKTSYVLTVALGILAGIIDERVIQFLLPMRYYDIKDIYLNSTGILIGVCLIFAYNMRKS